MNKLLWAALALAFCACASPAQYTPAGDFALGYSHFQIIKGFTIPMEGASNSVSFNVNSWFGLAGDFGVYHWDGGGLTGETYTFGPRFSYRKLRRVEPFAQGLFGGSHFSGQIGGVNGGPGNHSAFSFGGGADVPLGRSGKVAVRPQMDYFGVRINGATLNNVRVGIAFVYRIGAR